MSEWIGVATVTALVLCAVVAQAAMALDHTFNSAVNKTILTAEQDGSTTEGIHKFTPTGSANAIECHKFHADGTQVGDAANILEVIPQWSECTPFGGFATTVTNNGNTRLSKDTTATKGGCKLVFNSDTTANPSTPGVEDAPVSIQCEPGKSINTEIGGFCTIKVAEKHGASTVNQNLHGVKYNNVQTSGKKQEVTLEAKVHEIKYEASALCPLPATGSSTYEGNTTVRGFEDINEVGGETETGAQVNVFMTTP